MITNSQLEKALKEVDKILRKKTKDFEYDLLLQYKKVLEKIRKELFNLYQKYGNEVTFAEMSKYNRLTNFENQIAGEIEKLAGISIKSIGAQLKNHFVESNETTIEFLNKNLSFEIQYAKFNPDVIAEAVKNPFDRVKWQIRSEKHHINAIDQVKTEITQGLIQGKGYSQTAANIKDKVNELANNMTRIVRTESHRVQVLGNNVALDKSILAGKKLGIELVKAWVSIIDGRSKDRHHEKMNGQQIGDDGYFTYPDGSKTTAPGQSGIAKHDIQCRCILIVKVKDLK